MKKINWFKRLFMSWTSLEKYFNNEANVNIEANEDMKNLYQQIIDEKNSTNERLVSEIAELKKIKNDLENENKIKDNQLTSENKSLNEFKTRVTRIEAELEEKRRQNDLFKNDIRDKMSTIGKIEQTFFAKSGNKGKGELGEQQVRTILEKSGLPKELWVENLTVNNNTVEFAMKSGEEGKFIPIDSKVLDAELDDNGLVIIDDKYKNKVSSAAKEIHKYLGKSNTTNFGILVLQSDSIYMKLFEEYPTFFQEMIEKYKININSPSSFIQSAWQISYIISIYNRVHNDEKIYEDMIGTLETISKFANNMSSIHKTFNTAMNQYGTIERKHTNLSKRLDKAGKIKPIKKLELEGANDE